MQIVPYAQIRSRSNLCIFIFLYIPTNRKRTVGEGCLWKMKKKKNKNRDLIADKRSSLECVTLLRCSEHNLILSVSAIYLECSFVFPFRFLDSGATVAFKPHVYLPRSCIRRNFFFSSATTKYFLVLICLLLAIWTLRTEFLGFQTNISIHSSAINFHTVRPFFEKICWIAKLFLFFDKIFQF